MDPVTNTRARRRRDIALQASRFIAVGLMNTGIGLVLVYVSIYVFGMGQLWGNFAGYILGLIFSFLFHRNWTFRSKSNFWSSGVKFILAFVISYGMNIACVIYVRHLGVAPALAQAAGVVPYVFSFFLLSRYVVFREPHQS
jgi:putative flippase GtrA